MRFFSPAWLNGEWSAEKDMAVYSAYETHIDTLSSRLPGPVRKLATDVSLHDGLIRRIVVDRSVARLTVELRCGDLQNGYFDLDLRYSGVDMNSIDILALRELAETSKTEALYDEVDRDLEDKFVHRILFWIGHDKQQGPYQEIAVRFRELDLQQVSRPDRELDTARPRFEEPDANNG